MSNDPQVALDQATNKVVQLWNGKGRTAITHGAALVAGCVLNIPAVVGLAVIAGAAFLGWALYIQKDKPDVSKKG